MVGRQAINDPSMTAESQRSWSIDFETSTSAARRATRAKHLGRQFDGPVGRRVDQYRVGADGWPRPRIHWQRRQFDGPVGRRVDQYRVGADGWPRPRIHWQRRPGKYASSSLTACHDRVRNWCTADDRVATPVAGSRNLTAKVLKASHFRTKFHRSERPVSCSAPGNDRSVGLVPKPRLAASKGAPRGAPPKSRRRATKGVPQAREIWADLKMGPPSAPKWLPMLD